MRPEFAPGPAAPDPDQPGVGERHYPFDLGHWQLAYLCAFQDRYTKHVVGWQVRADMPEALVTSALQRALLAQRPAPGLIAHSDRGGQYVGNTYKALLRGATARLSHSRRGSRDDNAQAESRWSRLKTEELEHHKWPIFVDLADAQGSVSEYVDYYNHDRHHSSIGYLKPYQFNQQQLNNITQFSAI